MARSIWTGAIGFGLVNVPVRLYSATEDKTVHFHQLDESTGKRIHNQRVTDSGKEVAYEDIVKGYEVSKGKYVTLTDEELAAAEPGRSRTIEIEDFVELGEIDPIYFQKTYYLFPDERADASKPFGLLRRALDDAGRIGIGRFVMRGNEYLAAIRPYDGILALETMFFPDEVREPNKVADSPKNARVSDRERAMAEQLIDSLTTAWDPKKYRDNYRDRVLDIIERKRKGEEIVVEEAPAEESNVVDLMEVLRRSIEQGGRRTTRGRSRTARAAKRAPAKKRTATKRASKTSKSSKPAKATKKRRAS
jgi:DNA end-binding protein Ku